MAKLEESDFNLTLNNATASSTIYSCRDSYVPLTEVIVEIIVKIEMATMIATLYYSVSLHFPHLYAPETAHFSSLTS